MENEPEVIYRSVYKCSNCGAIVHEKDVACENCGAKLGEARSTRHPKYDKQTVTKLIQSVPDGNAKSDGAGGVGEHVSNHYIAMGHNVAENPLTWKAIALSISLLRLEGYISDVMMIHPYQMYDLLRKGGVDESFVSHDAKGGKDGVIGFIAGMEVVVSQHMTPGYVVIFDSEHYPEKISAGVLLFGGGTSMGAWGQW